MNFELPDDVREEYGVELSLETKRKVLGENAAGLYGMDIASRREALSQDPIGRQLAGMT